MDITNAKTQEEIRKKIIKASDDNVAAFAHRHGFTPNYIHQIRRGGPISDKAARTVGYLKLDPVFVSSQGVQFSIVLGDFQHT